MSLPKHRVAVIQLYSKPLAAAANHAHACDLIRGAASKGAMLAVLPEYHLTGWYPDDPEFVKQAALYKGYVERYQNLAKELDVCIVPGTIVEQHPCPTCSPDCSSCPKKSLSDPEAASRFHLVNVAYLIDNRGRITGAYQKKNLWHPERPYLTSSMRDAHQAFDSPLGKIGLLVCWDLAFPEAFRALIADGAKIVIIPSCWTADDSCKEGIERNPRFENLLLDSMITARSFENTCAVIFANAGGPGARSTGPGDVDDSSFLGLSQVTLPFVGSLETLGTEEGVIVVDVDMEILEEAEEVYKIRRDMSTEGWHYTPQHVPMHAVRP